MKAAVAVIVRIIFVISNSLSTAAPCFTGPTQGRRHATALPPRAGGVSSTVEPEARLGDGSPPADAYLTSLTAMCLINSVRRRTNVGSVLKLLIKQTGRENSCDRRQSPVRERARLRR